MKSKGHTCPVCGYNQLSEPPHSASGGGSYEICPSCGFQFGVSDDDDGISYDEWRKQWISEGMPWSSKGIPKPRGWRPDRSEAGKKSVANRAVTKRPTSPKPASKKAAAPRATAKKSAAKTQPRKRR